MHVWLLPEKPVTPSSPGEPSVPPANAAVSIDSTSPDAAGHKMPRPRTRDPEAFPLWMVRGNRLRSNKALEGGE
ncbi:hypothetical protein BP00DRAFT_422174 [Aspergillus indologenus CBS 114.80]|uniref:Uncharacterized protein n=1 Tax=Aspergillus indologenus CBS 114.80 TaxID=1450541 RepID=A0A2V5JGC2_9EURO|nr:hypothetical protein BP00DRAFT_422174 [Aspergillus indologenus CBS 114.80]